MNTLKMKVLLILVNKHLGWCVSRSVLIWFCTSLLGAIAVYAIEYSFPTAEAILLSLLFSSPALLLAVPTLYFLPSFQAIPLRILFSVIAVLAACILIIGIVSRFFHVRYSDVIEILFPFIPSAIGSYFLIARKKILKPSPIPSIN
jgi:hypothetical protein